MSAPAIEVNGLTVRYPASRKGRKAAVSNLSFRVETGEIVGFVGPNGAGKTSAIKALLNLIPSPPGACFIWGIPSCDPQSRARLGYMPEISYYPKYLKLSEFLHVCAAVSGIPRRLRPRSGLRWSRLRPLCLIPIRLSPSWRM